jgi:nicotinamidase-related amidase
VGVPPDEGCGNDFIPFGTDQEKWSVWGFQVNVTFIAHDVPEHLTAFVNCVIFECSIALRFGKRVCKIPVEPLRCHLERIITCEWIGDRRTVTEKPPVESQHPVGGHRTNTNGGRNQSVGEELLGEQSAKGMTDDNGWLRLLAQCITVVSMEIPEREFPKSCRGIRPQVGGIGIMQRPGDGFSVVTCGLEIPDPIGPAFCSEEHPVDENDFGFHGRPSPLRPACQRVKCPQGQTNIKPPAIRRIANQWAEAAFCISNPTPGFLESAWSCAMVLQIRHIMPTTWKNTALLLIDVINDMAFPAAPALLRQAVPAAHRIAALRRKAASKGVPVIYVNDNFGHWQCDFNAQIQRCIAEDSKGREVAALLLPGPDDYFVLKPKHSGFYSTSLDVLLSHLGVDTLILTGFAADICVLYTANDAYMRDYSLIVPSDCVAAESEAKRKRSLEHMHGLLKARVCCSASIR